jgi:hypothetical protein
MIGARRNDPMPATSTEPSRDPSTIGGRPWGFARWAAWTPELLNALVVGIPIAILVELGWPRSDAELQRSMLDIYEGSQWAVFVAAIFVALGVGCAVITRLGSVSSSRRRLAALQIVVLLLAFVAVVALQNQLATRIYALPW